MRYAIISLLLLEAVMLIGAFFCFERTVLKKQKPTLLTKILYGLCALNIPVITVLIIIYIAK